MIRHILFDLGGTLMYSRENWLPVLQQADLALSLALLKYGIALEAHTFRARLHQYYEQRDKNFEETTYHLVLRELLRELGHTEVTESVLREALDALYSVTQKNWVLEDDCAETIRALKSRRYHLGILSNAGDDKDVQQLVAGFGIHAEFDFVLTSAACYYRKPHPRAFELALAHWGIPPQEAVMVGDSLCADMEGAKKLAMQTVWITRRAEYTPEEKQRIQPDYEISRLKQLLNVVEKINKQAPSV